VHEIGNSNWDNASHIYHPSADAKPEKEHRIVIVEGSLSVRPFFRVADQSFCPRTDSISPAEYETLIDLLLGLTDRGIALRQHMSVRGVQNRISSLSQKLLKGADNYLKETAGIELYNTRVRIVLEALKLGIVDPDDLDRVDQLLDDWLLKRFKFDHSDVFTSGR
jgi:hypothetical protein